MNTEIEFLNLIDCNFPYLDRNRDKELIHQASKISDNALFCIIEEICRVPYYEKSNIPKAVLLDLLNLTSNKLNHHPLQEMITDVASKVIDNQKILLEEALNKMKIVQKYKGQFCALNIIYFACDPCDDVLDYLYTNIKKEWEI